MTNQDNRKDNLFALAVALLPFLIFAAVYEIAVAILEMGWNRLLQSPSLNTAFAGFLTSVPDVQAIITAIAMACGLLAILRTAGSEIRAYTTVARSTRHPQAKSLERFTARQASFAVHAIWFVSTLALAIGINLLLSLTGAVRLAGGASTVTGQTELLPGLTIYGIFTPFVEESVFRGTVYARLRRLLPAPHSLIISMIFSGLMFAIWHGNLPQGCYALLLGIIFAAFYEWTGNFVAVVFLHAAVNMVMLLLSQLGVYNNFCTPAWCVTFLAVGAVGFGCLFQILKRNKG